MDAEKDEERTLRVRIIGLRCCANADSVPYQRDDSRARRGARQGHTREYARGRNDGRDRGGSHAMAGCAVTAGTAGAVGTSGRTWTRPAGRPVPAAAVCGRCCDLRCGLRAGPSGGRRRGPSGGVCGGRRDGPRGGGQPAKTRTDRPRVRNDRRGQEESARGPRVRRGGQRLHGAVVEGSRRGGGR